jgi:hypothetical protein
MTWSGSKPAWRRRALMMAALACAFSVSTTVGAARPSGQAAQAPQAAQGDDGLTFNVDSVTMFFQVAEPAAADFEAFMVKVKEVLTKSDKPERKQQAASWKMFVKLEAATNGILTYIWILDPVAKGVSYDLFKILAEGLPPDQVQEIYKKVGPSIKGISKSVIKIMGDTPPAH